MSHDLIDTRSLEAHVLMASRVEQNPALRGLALETLDRWMARPFAFIPYFQKWRDLLVSERDGLLATPASTPETGGT